MNGGNVVEIATTCWLELRIANKVVNLEFYSNTVCFISSVEEIELPN